MEFSIEHTHIRHARHFLFTGFDTGKVGGVVQGAQRETFADDGLGGFVDLHRSSDLFTAVQNTMAHCGDFRQTLDHTDFRVHQFLADFTQSTGVIFHINFLFKLESIRPLVDQIGAIGAQTFIDALRHHFFVLHGEQRKLHGGTAGVYHQNLHFPKLLLY